MPFSLGLGFGQAEGGGALLFQGAQFGFPFGAQFCQFRLIGGIGFGQLLRELHPQQIGVMAGLCGRFFAIDLAQLHLMAADVKRLLLVERRFVDDALGGQPFSS